MDSIIDQSVVDWGVLSDEHLNCLLGSDSTKNCAHVVQLRSTESEHLTHILIFNFDPFLLVRIDLTHDLVHICSDLSEVAFNILLPEPRVHPSVFLSELFNSPDRDVPGRAALLIVEFSHQILIFRLCELLLRRPHSCELQGLCILAEQLHVLCLDGLLKDATLG